MSGTASSTRDSHAETMVKKTIRAEISLLRDDWFLPVLAAALDKGLTYVGQGHNLSYREAAQKALTETYEAFDIEGIAGLVNPPTPPAIDPADGFA